MSRKMIIYCANVHESTSLIGMNVWWLNVGFLAMVERKCFSLPQICRKCSAEFLLSSTFKLFEVAIKKRSISNQDQPTPLSYFSSLFIVVLVSHGFTHYPPNHDGYCLSKR